MNGVTGAAGLSVGSGQAVDLWSDIITRPDVPASVSGHSLYDDLLHTPGGSMYSAPYFFQESSG